VANETCIGAAYHSMECQDVPTEWLPCGHGACEACLQDLLDWDILRSCEDICPNCREGKINLATWSAGVQAWEPPRG